MGLTQHIINKFLNFAIYVPLLLSLIVCLTNLCKKCATNKGKGKSVFSAILSKDFYDFLWQIPYVQLIRHFILWNELRKAVLEKQRIDKFCTIKGMPLLAIIRSTQLGNLQQSCNINDIQQELEKTVLSKKAILFILKVCPCLYHQAIKKFGSTFYENKKFLLIKFTSFFYPELCREVLKVSLLFLLRIRKNEKGPLGGALGQDPYAIWSFYG